MFGTSNNSSVQSEFLINRRNRLDLWVQLNHTGFSRLGNLTQNSSIQKKWFDSLGPSSSPFPLQSPSGMERELAVTDWLLTVFLQTPCLVPTLYDQTPVGHIARVASISFPWQACDYSLAARLCSMHLAERLTWHWPSRINLKGGFSTLICWG